VGRQRALKEPEWQSRCGAVLHLFFRVKHYDAKGQRKAKSTVSSDSDLTLLTLEGPHVPHTFPPPDSAQTESLLNFTVSTTL
jgi:hypothetical protein